MTLPQTPEALSAELEKRVLAAIKKHTRFYGRVTELQQKMILQRETKQLDDEMTTALLAKGYVRAFNRATGEEVLLSPEQYSAMEQAKAALAATMDGQHSTTQGARKIGDAMLHNIPRPTEPLARFIDWIRRKIARTFGAYTAYRKD